MINIKEFCKENKELYQERISNLTVKPTLAIIWVGDSKASEKYVNNKIKDCQFVGIQTDLYHKEDMDDADFIDILTWANNNYDFIIVQKPLPAHLEEVFEHSKQIIYAHKDIDAINSDKYFYPCTPYGICMYLDANQIDVSGKDVVIVGRSELVGRPLAKMLTNKNATVTLCHSYTKDIYKYVKDADIVVCAVGKEQFLDCSKVNPEALIIDVGINFNAEGKMIGDCYNALDTQYVTPVPGGVGLLTRLALVSQICEFSIKMGW